MAMVSNPERMGRGLTKAEAKALTSLQLFLQDHGVTDIDLEPQAKGVTITASRSDGKPAFTAWGANIQECVVNMVRCVTK